MSEPVGEVEPLGDVVESGSGLLDALAAERRRIVLATLLREGPSLAEPRIAATVAAREADKAIREVTERERRDARVACHHVHLPKLQEVGLVDWERDDGVVRLARPGLLRRSGIEPIVSGRTDLPAEVASTTLSLLTSERRRAILTYLQSGARTLDELAARIAEDEHPGGATENERRRVAADLHHTHLPKLVDAGLVERGADGEVLTYRGNDLLDDWDLL